MLIKISAKGQIGLPSCLRKILGLRSGDLLDANIEGGRVVLTPRRTPRRKPSIIADPLTGSPVLTAGPGTPVLTSKQIKEMLDGFP
jgi:AbrB family looped-hinge helix DNA binding protein